MRAARGLGMDGWCDAVASRGTDTVQLLSVNHGPRSRGLHVLSWTASPTRTDSHSTRRTGARVMLRATAVLVRTAAGTSRWTGRGYLPGSP